MSKLTCKKDQAYRRLRKLVNEGIESTVDREEISIALDQYFAEVENERLRLIDQFESFIEAHDL